ncbi:MAG TPA: glutathione S-transferase N-terminal domain-containing protein [Kofleriaceae bacterium]|nr:glutathione S-transferase N-terminal domain-containing protein [Kofleriaceae bacterium]
MQLYFSPLACSMATRIALYEAGADAAYIEVDPKTKLTLDGADYRKVHPLGLVPALRTDDGELVTENAAVLQYLVRRFPEARLGPSEGLPYARLQQWLCFIGTELHKGTFAPLLDRAAPEAVKTYTLERSRSRLAYLSEHLANREYLLASPGSSAPGGSAELIDQFSVADAYLVTVLNWTLAVPIALKDWPALDAYVGRLRSRASVAKAMREEQQLYAAEVARHRA